MRILIVGGVAGGASAAARLRRLNENAEIIIFEKDEFISFANCGLPYHISGAIQERSDLILQTPESFKARFNIEVRVFNLVTKIDRTKKELTIKNLQNGSEYQEAYDKLILSPGASPFVPPLKGSNNFMTLRNIPDMDKIISFIKNRQVKSAIIIGGGFIGVEVAENLQEIGVKVNIIEMANQLVTPMDLEMANILHAKMQEHGISLHLGVTVDEASANGVTLNNGVTIDGELIISAIGVRPESSLASAADLKLGKSGGILVDDQMRTNDPDIYAVGDAIEITHFITKKPGLIPLAGPANKQGRIAADNIMGKTTRYQKTQGTGILKVYNLQAAFTGINERMAKAEGYNYEAIHLHPMNHAGYYPDACEISLKVIYDKKTKKILGAQGVGASGVDKRIDIFATAIRAGLAITDLTELELSYAPPFGSAKDPVNMAGFVAENIINGVTRSITWDKVALIKNHLILDVRTDDEVSMGMIPNSTHIPIDSLRTRLNEIPKDKPIILVCKVGIRGHIGYQILNQNGFKNLYNLSGGYTTYINYTSDIKTNESIIGHSGIGEESRKA